MEIQGIIVPILTPMHPDESLDLPALRQEAERLIAAGVHGLFPCGTNGEGYCLTFEEKLQVIDACVRQARGRVPVYAMTGCVSTRETIALSREAEALGADALSIVTPYFAAASQEALLAHYTAVARSVHVPIVLYHIPMRAGNTLSSETVAKLSQVDQIQAVKDSSGSFDTLLQYIAVTRRRRDFSVLCGSDGLILWTLLAGGRGGVAGCANLFPQTLVGVYRHAMAGQFAQALRLQESIRPFRDCFRLGNPNTLVKAAAQYLGYPVGDCRAPFHQLSDQARAQLRQALDTMQKEGLCP